MSLQKLKLKMNTKVLLGSLASSTLFHGHLAANVIGSGTQNFAPTTGFHDFATVHSSETLPSKNFHLGLFLNNATNSLPYNNNVSNDDRVTNQLLGADFVAGYGITDRFHLAISAPFVVNQKMDDNENSHSRFSKEGNTELRFHAKYKLLGQRDKSGLAFLFTAAMDRMGDNPHRGSNIGMAYIPEIAGDLKVSSFIFSTNLGYKIQDQGEPVEGALFEPFGNKILYSAAAGVLINDRKTKIYLEMFGDRPTSKPETSSDRELASMETLVGVKHLLRKNLSLNAGAGRELMHGVATPDLRIYAGMNWLIEPATNKPQMIAKKKPVQKKRRLKKKKRDYVPPMINTQEETIAAMDLLSEPVATPMMATSTAPSTAPLPTQEPDEVIVINNVNFVFDSDYQLLKGGLEEIDKVSRYVASKKGAARIVIEGHTCHMGSFSYNEDLSYRRAQSIRTHLVQQYGFTPDQVIAVGYGEARPTAENTSERGRRMNRRVEFKIYYNNTLAGN